MLRLSPVVWQLVRSGVLYDFSRTVLPIFLAIAGYFLQLLCQPRDHLPRQHLVGAARVEVQRRLVTPPAPFAQPRLQPLP